MGGNIVLIKCGYLRNMGRDWRFLVGRLAMDGGSRWPTVMGQMIADGEDWPAKKIMGKS